MNEQIGGLDPLTSLQAQRAILAQDENRVHASVSAWKWVGLWTALLLYLVGRCCQLYADKLPLLLIVVLHVVPPAICALVHGAILYRVRGLLFFATFCLAIGAAMESLSLRTGFPFGHYHFTNVMGPKIVELPILLVFAYLGIGYCAWIVSLLILQYQTKVVRGARVFALPLLAAFVMLAWDLAMDPDWSTVDRAWIWHNGGAFYGVPISNFFGWFLTGYLFYQAFALYCRAKLLVPLPCPRTCWRIPVFVYGACALGNLLIVRLPMAPPVITDATGRPWLTSDILNVCSLISLLVMTPMTLLAWIRANEMYGEH